jgi:hypothetical protein
MAITTMAAVKTVSRMYDLTGVIAPTTATVGDVGDIYLDTETGLSYECTAVNTGPPITYTWTGYTTDDALITMYLTKAEKDYLRIRGIAFEIDADTEETVYPEGSDTTAAEMVCYLLGWGTFEGRGVAGESFGGKAATFDKKICGYPYSIVGGIDQYHGIY